MKARALPHRPASNRPARRWLTLSLFACVRVTRLRPSFSWAIPRVAVRSPSTKRFCSGLGGGGGTGVDSARTESVAGGGVGGGGGGGVGSCALAAVAARHTRTVRQRISAPPCLTQQLGL